MKLFEYNVEIEKLFNQCVNEETGEISEDFEERLEALECEKAVKVLNTAKYITSLKAESKAFKDAIDRITARKQSNDKKIDRITKYLEMFADGDKYQDAECQVSWRKSKKVIVEDVEKLPKNYLTIKETKTADKKAIKEALTNGEQIEGCSIEESRNIQIK